MTTDGIQHVGGEADLIDGALRGSRSKEDGYRADEEEQEELIEEEELKGQGCTRMVKRDREYGNN